MAKNSFVAEVTFKVMIFRSNGNIRSATALDDNKVASNVNINQFKSNRIV